MSNVKKVIGVIGRSIGLKKVNAAKLSPIWMPDETVQKSLMGIVQCHGSEVRNKSLKKHSLVISDGFSVKKLKVKGEDNNDINVTLLAKEDHIMMIKVYGVWYPYGKFSLIERINEEVKKDSGIVIPACYDSSDESLYGVFVRSGHYNNSIIDLGINVGDIVHISKWHKDIKELELDGKYHFIVPNHLIDFTCTKDVMIENFVCR